MKRVFITLLLLIGAAVVFVSTRPATFHVERSVTIAAPASTVYGIVNNLHRWNDWSPWEKLDPAMTRTFDGPDEGVDASYHWAGNDKVGEGRMTVTESTPGESVALRLEFLKPFVATSAVAITLSPTAGGTHVVWAMDGTNNFMAKAMSLFMNIDKTVGGDFERGLANLGTVAEADARQAPAGAAPTDSAAATPQ